MPRNNHHTIEEPSLNGHHVNHHVAPLRYEVRSEEVQDIMSKMPGWIIRQGTLVLFTVVILLFTGAYFIHYPDVIITSVSITSSNPPLKIVAQNGGKIQKIFVENNQLVKKDESICLLENSANYNDVILLGRMLNRLDTSLDLTQALASTSLNHYVQLGELQAGYADLYQSINQYIFFRGRDFLAEKVGQLQSQISYGSQLHDELQNKDVLLKEQLTLERKKFLADSSLVVDKVIAPLEFDNSKKELIDKQINVDATKTNILQNKLQQTEYFKTIADLQQQKLQQENDLKQKIRENVKRLQGQLDLWERAYLLKSPVEGNVAFFKFWKENQYVTKEEAVLMIVPSIQSYVARSLLPINGSGKVKAGQSVLIKLLSYPFEEFGMIRGKVGTISSVALDTAYSMEIQLTRGLMTTTGKRIPPQPQLVGIAEILTNDKNILMRLFETVRIDR